MLRFSLLVLTLLLQAPTAAASETCTETMARVDANQDGRLSLAEFADFVDEEAQKAHTHSTTVQTVPTEVVQGLFAQFATTSPEGDQGIGISTSDASQRAVLGLVCERTNRATRTQRSASTTDAKEEPQGPFHGEVVANKQDFDLATFAFAAWGIDWHPEKAQEICPEPWKELVSCIIRDCPQFMDVCPAVMAAIEESREANNATAGEPATGFPYTCTDIEDGLCSVLDKDQDCCLYDCAQSVQDMIDCVVLNEREVDLGCAFSPIGCPLIEAALAEENPGDYSEGDYGSMGDDDFFGSICTEELTALEACAGTNSCYECMSMGMEMDMGGGEPMPEEMFMDGAFNMSSIMGGGGEGGTMIPEFDIEAVLAQANTYLAQQCEYEKQNVCKLADCCPKCRKEMIAMYSCFSTSLSANLDEMLGGLFEGLGDVLANVTDALELAAEALEGLGDLEGLFANLTESLGDLDLESILANLTDTLGEIPGLEGMLGNITDLFGGDIDPEDLEGLLGGLLGNVTDLMSKQGGPPPTAPGPAPAGPDFTCDWSALKCGAGGGPGGGGPGGGGGSGGSGSDKPTVLVNSAFVLSSLNAGITAAQLKEQLQSGGAEALKEAFKEFVNAVVENLKGEGPPGGRRLGFSRKFSFLATRKLAGKGKLVPNSVEIYDIVEADCATAIQSSDAVAISKQGGENKTCFAVFGQYGVQLKPEDNAEEVYKMYLNATQTAISSGKLEAAMKEADPEGTSPFVVEGLSTIVDNNFDPYLLAQAATTSVSPDNPTPVPAATESSNATDAEREAATDNSNATEINATDSNTTETKSAAPAPSLLAGGYIVAALAMILVNW